MRLVVIFQPIIRGLYNNVFICRSIGGLCRLSGCQTSLAAYRLPLGKTALPIGVDLFEIVPPITKLYCSS